jgi:hypothetical protein
LVSEVEHAQACCIEPRKVTPISTHDAFVAMLTSEVRARFETRHAVTDVAEKSASLGELSVIHDINSNVGLVLHDLFDRLRELFFELGGSRVTADEKRLKLR